MPTLVDRDLVLYDSRVIIEYLDERFPHPPLMPVDPVTRAQFRLALYRIERDWYGLIAADRAASRTRSRRVKLKKILRDTILQSTDLFKVKPYFLSDEFSLVDATIAPDAVAPAVLRDRSAAPGAADPEVRAACCSRARRSAKACRRREQEMRLL